MKSTVGLGLRHSFHNYVLENKPAVPFFEVITENYLFFDGAPRNFLKNIRQDYPLAFHGVSLSIGSLEPVRLDYVTQLKKMISEYQPIWVSDHLCWTFNGKENSHDLLPIPFTKNSLERIVSKMQYVQEFLGRKIYLENPSAYIDFISNEYLEEDFIKELCTRSGCGLLLDLNNLVVNQYNLGYKPTNYLNTIKDCDVKQIHLAGHTVKEKVRIDTHDSPISQEVLDLLPLAKQFWPEASPMIEWDDKIPAIHDLLNLRDEIEHKWQASANLTLNFNSDLTNPPTNKQTDETENYQNFWNLLKSEEQISLAMVQNADLLKTNLPTPAYIGMNVYSSAYYNRLVEVLEKTFPVLKVALSDYFSDVMLDYLKSYPSTFSSIDFVGQDLGLFIFNTSFSFDLGVDKLILSDIANFEYTRSLAAIIPSEKNKNLIVKEFSKDDWIYKKIKLKSDVLVLILNSAANEAVSAIELNEVPEIPELKTACYVFYRNDGIVSWQKISEDCANFLNLFVKPWSFTEGVGDISADNIQKNAELLFENEKLFCVAAVDHV